MICQEDILEGKMYPHADAPLLPCNPHQRFFQFHGVWHLICAFALFIVYLWQRSEYKALLLAQPA